MLTGPSSTVQTGDLSPTVLFCHRFPDDYGLTLETFPQLPLRRTYDYELEIYLTDAGSMRLSEEQFNLQRGAVVFRRPGVLTQALAPYRCCSIIIDMTGRTGKNRDSYTHKAPQQIQPDYRNAFLDSILSVTIPEETEKLIYLFDRAYTEYQANWPQTPVILRAYVLEILHALYLEATRQKDPVLIHPRKFHKSIRRATAFIHENYARKLLLQEIAEYVGLSANYLSRLFIDCMGINISTYITNTRVQKARELLVYTTLPVADIATLCGFDSQAYFIYVFNRVFNMTPGRFRTQSI